MRLQKRKREIAEAGERKLISTNQIQLDKTKKERTRTNITRIIFKEKKNLDRDENRVTEKQTVIILYIQFIYKYIILYNHIKG